MMDASTGQISIINRLPKRPAGSWGAPPGSLSRCPEIPNRSALAINSRLDGFTAEDGRRALEGLPAPGDYQVVIKALRYRMRPSLSALCEFDVRRIVLRVPEPFRPFDELVYHAARRKPGPGWAFDWVSETVTFQQRREVLRFLYCHEWMHWYLREVLGRRSGAETACDRFALRNFRRPEVGTYDADMALAYRRMAPEAGARSMALSQSSHIAA